jgi:polyisoprenyl-phosphate glycosyltransferase
VKLSVVIPVYNEEDVLETTHAAVSALLRKYAEKGLIDAFEILYVEDGSEDGTLKILRTLAADSFSTKIISFSRNFGHQAALTAGILHASGDAVVSLDADLQDPPELMENMIEKYRLGNDIVYAIRRERNTDTAFKKLTARLFYRLMQIMGVNIICDHADYRLISRKVADAFKGLHEVNLFLRGIFPYLGFRHDIVHYDRQERHAGTTKYPLRKMLSFAWEGITSFSKVPLRLASVVGFSVFLLSAGLVVWSLLRWLAGHTVAGWTSIVVPMLIIGGLNMLFLGLIGEYISKIYLEVKRRQIFLIGEMHNIEKDPSTR